MKRRNYFASLAISAMALSMVACGDDLANEDDNQEVELATEAVISAFSLVSEGVTIEFTIDENQKTIEYLYDESEEVLISNATAVAAISEGATISPDLSVAADYTSEVELVVTSEDGLTSNSYFVLATEGKTYVESEQIQRFNHVSLGAGSTYTFDSAIAFSGDCFVTIDNRVYDLDGKYQGTVNFDGCYNEVMVSMTNDEKGVMVASIAIYSDGATVGDSESIVGGAIMAWKDGWESAPTMIYESTTTNLTRYISIAGDVSGDAILTIIDPNRGSTQMHHVLEVKDGDWNNITNYNRTLDYESNDGNWSQMFSASTADINDPFFVFDSVYGGVRAFVRSGIDGTDKYIYGTIFDDGIAKDSGTAGDYQFGNYTLGHIRPFTFNGDSYVIVSSSGWTSAYYTIIPANDGKNDYIMRTKAYTNNSPAVSSAYVYSQEDECGYVAALSSDYEVYIFRIYNEFK